MSDLAVGEKEEIDDRIRRIVNEQFNDPTRYNTNFKAWIPKWIETQGVQLPISQVTGAYLTATDTINLGGDVHGRIGMVRAGASPYDFVQLTYDSVYGKWVSTSDCIFQDVTSYLTTSTTYVLKSFGPTLPWSSFDAANLKPQFRLIAELDNDTAGSATATLGFSGLNAGDSAGGATYTSASWSITLAGTTQSMQDTGWQDPPAVTLKTFLQFVVHLKSSSGANTSQVSHVSVHVRWVSK